MMAGSTDMGRFSFDGAENIAFWVSDHDPELEHNVRVMFDDMPVLQEFLQHNFPGLPSSITDIQINRLAQYLYEEIGNAKELSLVMAMTGKPELVDVLTKALKRADVSVVSEDVQVTVSATPEQNTGNWMQRRFLGIS